MTYTKNFFSLPNALFLLGLCPGELAVYSYLRRCEDHETHQCWPSYRTIGKAVGMSVNTVSKYVVMLSERGLISTEPTDVITKSGMKRNGNLLYTLLPVKNALDHYYAKQLEELERETERQRVEKLLLEQEKDSKDSAL